MEDQKHLVFCRCWYGLDRSFPLDQFADIHSEERLEAAIRKASNARISEDVPDETSLEQLLIRAGWRRKRGGILRFDRDGHLIDPVFSPAEALLVLDSEEDAEVARQVLSGRLPSSVPPPLAHSSPCVPTLGVIAAAQLNAAARVEGNLQLQEQARELARWPEGPAREIHLRMTKQPRRMLLQLAAYAGNIYEQLCQSAEVAGDEAATEQAEFAEATGDVSETPEESSGVAYCFRKEGSLWRVRFGAVTKLVPHLQGYTYIHRLLLADGKPVALAELTPIIESSDKPMQRTDEAGLLVIKSRMKTAEQELGTAKEYNDLAAQERLRGELREVTAEYKESGGLGPGRRRVIGDGRDTARTRVGKAIEYACSKLDTEIDGLGSHLRDAIKNPSGLTPYCALAEGERWEL